VIQDVASPHFESLKYLALQLHCSETQPYQNYSPIHRYYQMTITHPKYVILI